MNKPAFRSDDYNFRPTSLSLAMQKAGLVNNLHLVRDPKAEATLRPHNDRANIRDSIKVHLKQFS